MLPEIRLPSEDQYIIMIYRFYLTTGLVHVVISFFIMLDFMGYYDFDYSNFYETAYIFFIFSIIYGFFPFLFFLPFIVKLLRYSRQNLWLSIPFGIWISQFLFFFFADYSRIFLELGLVCFICYGIIGVASGIHGIIEIKRHDSLSLERK